MNRTSWSLVLALIIALTGCSGDSDAQSKSEGRSEKSILGVYENKVDRVVVELKTEGKAIMVVDEANPYETTWERDGADRIIIYGAEGMRLMYTFNSDGNLSNDMGLGSVLRKK
jgi:hypothetical protein